jgi:hypothetical protein
MEEIGMRINSQAGKERGPLFATHTMVLFMLDMRALETALLLFWMRVKIQSYIY